MSREVGILLIALGYLVLSLAVGLFFGRRSGSSDSQGFVAANRSFGLLVMYFITGATIFSSFAFLGMPGSAYEKGAPALYVVSYGAVAMIPLYFFGPRIAGWGRRFGYLTQGDFVADRFSCPILPSLMAWVSLAAFLPYLVLQMEGAGYLLSTMTGGLVSEAVGSFLPYAVVMIYVLVGGVKGVGATNVLQGIFMLIIGWFLGMTIPGLLYGGIEPMFERIVTERPGHMVLGSSNQSIASYCSRIFVSVIGFTMWPHLFMKIFTSKSDRILKQTVVLYPTFLLFLVPIVYLGFAGVLFRDGVEPAGNILPLLMSELDLSVIVVGLFCAGGLAASMSSGDAIVHAASAVMIRDFGSRVAKMTPRGEVLAMRLLVFFLGLIAYLLANLTDWNLINLLLIGYGGVVQFFPVVIGGCYLRFVTRAGALAGLGIGVLLTVTGEILKQCDIIEMPFGLEPGVIGLMFNVVAFVLVSAVTKPPEDRDRFFSSGPGKK